MVITEQDLPELSKVKLRPKGPVYPICPQKDLPRPFFVSMFVASRGGGKTYSATLLLKLYEKHRFYTKDGVLVPQKIHLITPTYDANKHYFELLRNFDPKEDLYKEYRDGELQRLLASLEAEAEAARLYNEDVVLWEKAKDPVKNVRLDRDELFRLNNVLGWAPPTPPEYPWGRVHFLVLDDCIGTEAFKRGRSVFKNFLLRNRHLNCCVLIMTQDLMSVTKPLRQNASVFVLFKNASLDRVAKEMYNEISAILTKQEFIEVYKYATEKTEHSALIIDKDQPRGRQLKIDWNTLLTLPSSGRSKPVG
jgi:hypothetical protein